MDSYSKKYTESESCIDSKSCPYAEPIKESMDEYRYPRNQDDMIEVLMRVFVSMVMVYMVMWVCCEEFFEEIYHQKTSNKSINGVGVLFERFREYVNERYRKHRSCTESDEEMEDFLIDILKEVQNYTNRGNQKKSEYEEKMRHNQKHR